VVVSVLAPELELKLAVVVAALLLSFCSRQKLKRKQIPLLSRTIRVPFSSLPPITQKSLGTFYAYVDFTFNLTLAPERFQLSLPGYIVTLRCDENNATMITETVSCGQWLKKQ